MTLLLTPEDAQKLELAKNEGKISLSLRNPLDDTRVRQHRPGHDRGARPQISAPRAAAAGAPRAGEPGDPDDLAGVLREAAARAPRLEEEARKKEAEKPRVVVDVYRGDKHVQEIFQ